MPYVLLVTAFVVNALGTVFLKLNATQGAGFAGGVSWQTVSGNRYLLLALVLFASNVIFYYLALRTVPLAVAYPIMVTGTFLIVGAFSFLLFHEQVGNMQIFGYILVIAGITLVSAFS